MIKKSNSKKLNKFKTSPLIVLVAVLEVIVLICVSTYAWFVFAENNKANTDFISVEPDSGLDIDFNEANEQDYINIWNYLEEFQFEPVTSLDGRNIFVPTTGTFNSTDTSKIKFREATVNDMNSKYINIDFSLTNTGEEDMDVYLNSRSYFKFDDSANGKALRLAFYQNDGSSGAVSSSLLSQEYDGDTPEDPEDPDSPGDTQSTYLVYFDVEGSNWTSCWIEADFTVETGINRRLEMQPVSEGSSVYYIDLKKILDTHGSTNFTFMKFHRYNYDAGNTNMTVQLPAGQIESNTVYSFDLKNGSAYEGTVNSHTGLVLADPKLYSGIVPDVGGDDSGDSGTGDDDTGEVQGQTTVYFNNTLGWEQPYAYIWQENGDNDVPLSSWPGKPMTHISGNIYYYTFNSKYDYIIFNDGNSQGGAVKTQDIEVKDGHIYMISGTNNNGYGWVEEDYNGTVEGGTYPVISPGVSTGFQRPYAPVTQIDNNSGSASVVIPAFASSIDDYNFGSKKLFSIEKGKTLSLSMIVWLEGTDPDCTEDVYAGKDIDMNLVFATSGTGGEAMYTYKFLDKTKENWIDDKITTDTGVSFKPVMQLYDADNQKGYLMKLLPDGYTWTVDAPQTLVESKHIIFRRVNPMDENEVWNYWETHGFGDLEQSAMDEAVVPGADGENTTVYFTAFSDGAPTKAKKDKNATEDANAPEYSCGGLWGNHDTQLVTLYDGTDGHWLKNKEDGMPDHYVSAITMNYTYKGQNVEYKASGPDKDMYYFIVPTNVYSKNNGARPSITFKRYYNFNTKYALNSDKNPDLTYHRKWDAGACNGKFFEISASTSGTDHCYWGYDMLYVQAKEIVKSKMDNAFLQVHFYAADNGADTSGSDFYSYLYKNDNFKGNDNNYGYAAVVPSDRKYYDYRIERCNTSDHSQKYNISPLHEIVQYSSNNVSYPNCVADNICMIENFYLWIYFEAQDNLVGQDYDIHWYAYDNGNTHGSSSTWPGPHMEFVGNEGWGNDAGYQLYRCQVDVTRFNRIIFSNEWGGEYRKFLNSDNNNNDYFTIGSDSDTNGIIFQGTGSYPSNIFARKRSTVATQFPANETMNTVLANSPDWP